MSDISSGAPQDGGAAHDSAGHSDRSALEAAVVESVSSVPGVARLVPSFRQVLTAAAQRLLKADATSATGVDIVREPAGVVVYVDLYTDGSRPAGVVVDDVNAAIQALMHRELPAGAEAVQVRVRVMGVSDAR